MIYRRQALRRSAIDVTPAAVRREVAPNLGRPNRFDGLFLRRDRRDYEIAEKRSRLWRGAGRSSAASASSHVTAQQAADISG